MFELSPEAGGDWTYKVLHNFDPKCHNDGVYPYGSLVMGAAGNLFGTTYAGGAYGHGTVFMVAP